MPAAGDERQAADGGRDHTVLCPSSTPHERDAELSTADVVRYTEAGLKCGRH